MAKQIKFLVKIIPRFQNQIIGWRGDVVQIGLFNQKPDELSQFLASYLAIPESTIKITKEKDAFYSVTIAVKHIEDLLILLQQNN